MLKSSSLSVLSRSLRLRVSAVSLGDYDVEHMLLTTSVTTGLDSSGQALMLLRWVKTPFYGFDIKGAPREETPPPSFHSPKITGSALKHIPK